MSRQAATEAGKALTKRDVGDIDEEAARALCALEATLGEREVCFVAFSGGVDSSLLAAAALRALGPWDVDSRRGALAVLADSDTLARHELERARATAAAIGIRLHEIRYSEFDNEAWVTNDAMRCFHCKRDLVREIGRFAATLDLDTSCVALGVTTSDLGEHRPGIDASRRSGAWHPLVEAGLDKSAVRRSARALGLPVWDKPATPCLASRVQYGERITPTGLRRIEAAEAVVRGLGFSDFRVRQHDDLARVEVPTDRLSDALRHRDHIVKGLKRLGYVYVTLDLVGFRSGSMNEALDLGAAVSAQNPHSSGP